MKYLFVTQYFYPEEFRGNDIAFDWAARGDEVTVITAIPNYPIGKFIEGYGIFKRRREVLNGVSVIRVPVIARGNGGKIRLMLNYFSFAFIASFYAFFLSIHKKFDSIFVQQLSPVTIALPAIVVKKIQRIPLFLWVLDLWPESITSAGNIHNKQILWFFEKTVQFIYRNSDQILISSKGFEYSITQKGEFKDKLVYFPNWAEDTFKKKVKCKNLPKLPEGFIVMFAGNIGEAQDFENVMKAASLLKSEQYIKFVLVGDGRKKKWIDEYCKDKGLENTVYCLGRYPLDTMKSFFEKADVLLVSLKDEPIFNHTLPAKVQAYMTSAKPIIGMMNGEGANVIKEAQCGVCVNAGDYIGLVNAIQKLAKMKKSELIKLGINGQLFAAEEYDKTKLLDDLYMRIMQIQSSN